MTFAQIGALLDSLALLPGQISNIQTKLDRIQEGINTLASQLTPLLKQGLADEQQIITLLQGLQANNGQLQASNATLTQQLAATQSALSAAQASGLVDPGDLTLAQQLIDNLTPFLSSTAANPPAANPATDQGSSSSSSSSSAAASGASTNA